MIARLELGESLRSVLGNSLGRFYASLEDAECEQRYRRARDLRADLMVDEIVTIADSNDDPAKVRNRVQARQWVASKFRPREYGDRLEVHQTGHIDLRAEIAAGEARALAALPACYQVEAKLVEDRPAEPIAEDRAPLHQADASPLSAPGQGPKSVPDVD